MITSSHYDVCASLAATWWSIGNASDSSNVRDDDDDALFLSYFLLDHCVLLRVMASPSC